MKTLRSLVVLGALVLAPALPVSAAETAAPAADAAKKPESWLIADLRGFSQFFAYGTWDKQTGPTKDGILIQKGATGKGGCCADATINLEDAKWLEVGLATLPFNEVPALTVMFEDADGTNASFRFNVSQLVPGSPVWLRVPVKEASLYKPGTNGRLDGDKIVKWHVQGDWSTEKPVQAMIIALRARR